MQKEKKKREKKGTGYFNAVENILNISKGGKGDATLLNPLT